MVKVTKREAVQTLIRGAMKAYREGDEVCALTLAGAAEGAMPSAEINAFQVMRAVRGRISQVSEKDAAAALNKERNWLKHYNVSEPHEIEIDSAIVMLFRAVSTYLVVYGVDDLTREFGRLIGWLPTEKA